MYKNNLFKIVGKTAIGFVVAFLVMTQLGKGWGFGSWCSMAFLFSTVPTGWVMINKYLGSWFVGGSFAAAAIFFIVKLMASLLVGWIVTPIVLIYNIVMMVKEKQESQLQEHI